MLLTFVLAFGALTEARILGGQSVIVIAHDVEHAFTYAQNWPLGSALSVLLTLWIGGLVMAIFSKVDLDRILGKKEI
jgi:spermidine/putrescine transport system permease protein